MDYLEITLMWAFLNENSFDLSFIYPLNSSFLKCPNTGQQGYQQGCQQGGELSVSVVLVEQLNSARQAVQFKEQFSTTEMSLQVSRSER